jgi:hypothetical protein
MISLLSALLLTAPIIPDPLAPGREGWLGCTTPDAARKVCLGLKSYRWDGDTIIIEGQTVVEAEPLTVIHYRDEARYVGDAVCSWTRDIEAGILDIQINGVTLSGEAFLSKRREIAAPLLSTAGQKYCVKFEALPQGGVIMRPSMSGVRMPDSDMTMIWVRPDEGWTVGY